MLGARRGGGHAVKTTVKILDLVLKRTVSGYFFARGGLKIELVEDASQLTRAVHWVGRIYVSHDVVIKIRDDEFSTCRARLERRLATVIKTLRVIEVSS